MTMRIVAMVIMRRMGMSCAMSVIVMPVTVMIMGMIHLVAARIAPVRAEQRDRACDQRADERQEYNSLDHRPISPSSD
jgi:hypothetical protein